MAVSVGCAALSSKIPAFRTPRRRYLSANARTDVVGIGNSRVLELFAACALIVVAAARWHVGVDYWQYTENYQLYRNEPLFADGLLSEPGIRLLAKVTSWIRDDPALFLALASVITVGLTVETVRRHSGFFAGGVFLYIVSGTWQGSFNGVRQYLAAAILFAGHRLLVKRNLAGYLLLVSVATLFHTSALLMLVLWFVPRRPLGLYRGAVLMGGAIATTYAYAHLGSIADSLKGQEVAASAYFLEQVSPIRIVVAFAPLALYITLTRRAPLQEDSYFYVNMLVVNAAIMLASAGSAYIARFAIYTGVYVTLALPRLINMEERQTRALAGMAVAALYFGFWYADTAHVPALAEYHWIFERNG